MVLLPLDCNLAVIERLAYSSNPTGYARGGFIPLASSTKLDRTKGCKWTDTDPGPPGWGFGSGLTTPLCKKTKQNTETNFIEEGAPALGIMMLPSQTCKRDGKQTNLLMSRKSICVGMPETCYGKAAILAKEMWVP